MTGLHMLQLLKRKHPAEFAGCFRCLWDKKGSKFREPSLMKTGMPFAFVTAMGGVGFEYVAVSGFQLFQDAAFVDYTWAAVVGKAA